MAKQNKNHNFLNCCLLLALLFSGTFLVYLDVIHVIDVNNYIFKQSEHHVDTDHCELFYNNTTMKWINLNHSKISDIRLISSDENMMKNISDSNYSLYLSKLKNVAIFGDSHGGRFIKSIIHVIKSNYENTHCKILGEERAPVYRGDKRRWKYKKLPNAAWYTKYTNINNIQIAKRTCLGCRSSIYRCDISNITVLNIYSLTMAHIYDQELTIMNGSNTTQEFYLNDFFNAKGVIPDIMFKLSVNQHNRRTYRNNILQYKQQFRWFLELFANKWNKTRFIYSVTTALHSLMASNFTLRMIENNDIYKFNKMAVEEIKHHRGVELFPLDLYEISKRFSDQDTNTKRLYDKWGCHFHQQIYDEFAIYIWKFILKQFDPRKC